MSNTFKIFAAVVLAIAAVAAPQLQKLGSMLRTDILGEINGTMPAVPGELVIDHDLQLRLVCAAMAERLPDNEKLDTTNRLVDYLDTAFGEAFVGTSSPLAIGVIREEIGKALKFGDTSQPITQAERVTAANILAKYAKEIK